MFQLDIHPGGPSHPSPQRVGGAGEGVDYRPTVLSTHYYLDHYPQGVTTQHSSGKLLKNFSNNIIILRGTAVKSKCNSYTIKNTENIGPHTYVSERAPVAISYTG